uniref:NAD(P)H-quinone oxidoreductase subunit 6, chloroplastic n=1 Tax=Danaea sellowiana TaxID=2764331 RepID=A0A7G7YGZ1_9MONI|nr:NADH-plastoquinone oxidoreductase subunit 6 [Danaea sellowiana]QNH93761.1 NADH-plastoquinone oxidoreductase subunit 6 [Danaea sellowiana]
MILPEPTHKVILVIIELGIFLGSLGVVSLTNIIYSALLLGLVFICISLLYLVLNADFVAAAQVLIYVGAVNVLIVFAVMLIDQPKKSTFFSFSDVGDNITLGVCTSLFILLTLMISDVSWSKIYLTKQSTNFLEQNLTTDVQLIGSQLLTKYLLPFELLSILLLVALVGAITIARQERVVEIDDNEVSDSKEDLSLPQLRKMFLQPFFIQLLNYSEELVSYDHKCTYFRCLSLLYRFLWINHKSKHDSSTYVSRANF